MSISSRNRYQAAVRQRNTDRETLAAKVRKNAEDLMIALCGKGTSALTIPPALLRRELAQRADGF
jgi:hypothetical protein